MDSKLRQLRKSKKVQIAEITLALKCSRNTISQYETGKRTPSIETMQKLAKALEVDLQTIVNCFVKDKNENNKKD